MSWSVGSFTEGVVASLAAALLLAAAATAWAALKKAPGYITMTIASVVLAAGLVIVNQARTMLLPELSFTRTEEGKEVQKKLDAALKEIDALKRQRQGPGGPKDQRRPPDIRVLFAGVEPGSGVIFAAVGKEGTFTLPALLFKNVGDSPTQGNLSVRMKFSVDVQAVGMWQQTQSLEKAFPSEFYWGGPFYSISPTETWTGPPFTGKFTGEKPKLVTARVDVYYGQPTPSSATFTVIPQ